MVGNVTSSLCAQAEVGSLVEGGSLVYEALRGWEVSLCPTSVEGSDRVVRAQVSAIGPCKHTLDHRPFSLSQGLSLPRTEWGAWVVWQGGQQPVALESKNFRSPVTLTYVGNRLHRVHTHLACLSGGSLYEASLDRVVSLLRSLPAATNLSGEGALLDSPAAHHELRVD